MQYLLSETEYGALKEKEKVLDDVQQYIKKSSRPHFAKAYNGFGNVVQQIPDGTKLDVNLVSLFEMLGFDFCDGLHIEIKSE